MSGYQRQLAPKIGPQDVGHESVAIGRRELSLPSLTCGESRLSHRSFQHRCRSYVKAVMKRKTPSSSV